ncbi:hypothetical protein GOV14_04680 [Candidatus Pacearchaeota archaeon]|nr:hypothetical protein [Candidatus Pacearchaeota archaeon]
MNKKSQMHTMETIVVLFVFFILLIMGFIFYVRVAQSNIGTEQEEARQLKAIEIAQRAMFLPEIQCSEENIISNNCIDYLKLVAASEIIKQNELYYYDKLGFSNITITQIYPNPKNWTLYDKSLEEYQDKIITNIPISIFDPREKKNSFGVMKVEYFRTKE